MRVILAFLALAYEFIMRFRNYLYDRGVLRSYSSSLPVISIGNVTAGGNGKTPLCMLIVRELSERGYKPIVLSRGYGGSEVGPHVVACSDEPVRVGDEPLVMVRQSVPVVVCRKRAAGARFIEQMGDFNVIVLDDGLQHRALNRDFEIASIFVGSRKAINQFVAGKLLPLGLFRENRDQALRRVHAVVLNYRSIESQKTNSLNIQAVRDVLPEQIGVYTSSLTEPKIVWLDRDEPLDPSEVGVFTAIANPSGVVQSLEAMGFVVRETKEFSDHHVFSEEEIRELLDRNPNLPFVCTEKDAVKISRFTPELRKRLAVLSVRAKVEPAGEFISHIEGAIATKLEVPYDS